MTTQTELRHKSKFVRAVFPWVVAATAMVVYLATLNRWVSFNSLPYVARVTGLMWTPELTGSYGSFGPCGPLFYLVTYPFRWLPAQWVPLALNLFAAVCAALVLALLARSVALLPHDRTHEQRQREHSPFSLLSIRAAWIPPALAAAVCGLQLAFWENATAASGDIFELLLFAYVARCLLEYRIAWRDSWLLRAALVYGAAMTGSWVMIGFLPLFVAAMLWIRGISFFNLRFLRSMMLCGLTGLLLYLLLPLVYVISESPEASFWQALKVNLGTEKNVLQFFVLRMPKDMLLLLATTSFLPIFLIGIRWSSYFGDPSKVGIAVTTAILHLAHAAFLGVCLWVAFDPEFSPTRRGLVFLPLYYLGALSIGYLAGYFLLVFQPLSKRMGQVAPWQVGLYRFAQVSIWGLLLLVPAGLAWKNLPQIRMTNGPAVMQYASLLTRNLPEHAVLLSESEGARGGNNPIRLWLAQAWYARNGKSDDYLFLDTQSMQVPTYHAFLQKRHPNEMPALVNAKVARGVAVGTLINLITKLSEKNAVYYLHPSFGYYFEFFSPKTRGMGFEMTPYPTNLVDAPKLTDAELDKNEAFWQEAQPVFDGLLPFIEQPDSYRGGRWGQKLMNKFGISFQPNPTALALGQYYSQSLTAWGAELQRARRLKEAGQHFNTALDLKPGNVVARFNLACNRDLRAGTRLEVKVIRSLEEEFGRYRNWEQVLRENGPFDDPTHCFGEAITFVQGRLFRQSAQQFERVHQLVPDHVLTLFWLAQFYANRVPERALALLAELRGHVQGLADSGIRPIEISATEAVVLFSAHRETEAEQLLQTIMAENPKDEKILAMVAQISSTFGRFTNALLAVERQLQIKPDDTAALVAKGYLHMQTGDFQKAIPVLSHVLSLETNNYTAQFNRAIAYLQFDKLAEAQQDYEALQHVYPNSFRVYYGLGEIAWRRKDTNAAIRYYELYLTNSAPESEEGKMISERLLSLKPASP
jgi:Flp pilus assembly protein TadD